jgi:hypothetical protein
MGDAVLLTVGACHGLGIDPSTIAASTSPRIGRNPHPVLAQDRHGVELHQLGKCKSTQKVLQVVRRRGQM